MQIEPGVLTVRISSRCHSTFFGGNNPCLDINRALISFSLLDSRLAGLIKLPQRRECDLDIIVNIPPQFDLHQIDDGLDWLSDPGFLLGMNLIVEHADDTLTVGIETRRLVTKILDNGYSAWCAIMDQDAIREELRKASIRYGQIVNRYRLA